MISEILFPLTDYLKGKPIFPVSRRVLNILFSISISSFLFEKFYFKYYWIDITDYKAILDYFVKGDFFVPFSVFVIVHFGIGFFAELLFLLITELKSIKIKTKIIQYEAKNHEVKYMLASLNHSIIKLDETLLRNAYLEMRNEISDEKVDEINKSINEQKKILKDNFILILRILIAITIYFSTINYFGWILYLMVLLVLLLLILVIWFSYLSIDLFITFLIKCISTVDKYLEQKYGQQMPK